MKNKIEKVLKDANIKFEFVSLSVDLAPDVESHMKFHGYPMRYAMPNIVFKTEKGFVVVQRCGDTKLDSKKIKKVLGVHDLRVASKEELENLGLEPGIVPPTGFDAKFLMDKNVLENELVFTGTGDKLYTIKLTPKDLQEINNPIIGDFTEGLKNKINFYISSKVKEKFPDLDEVVMPVYEIDNSKEVEILTAKDFQKQLEGKTEEEFYNQTELVDFRRFCEDLDINLKRFPPSVEFLYKRFQKNGKVPQINCVVDCANKVAVEALVATGVFDLDQIKGDLILRFSKEGEEFKPLGGDTENLPEGLVVISDDEKILNLFPFRDSIYQKITKDTRNVLILADKVPGGNLEHVKNAVIEVGELISKHTGGEIGELTTSEIKVDVETVVSVDEISKDEVSTKRRVFAGVRASGSLHLGNYLGAIKGFLELQKNPNLDCVFMAVDVHTITTPFDHLNQPKLTRGVIMDYLACGLDPEKVILAVQSMVPEHTELAFLFSSAISVARMQHLPTFKDKIKQHPDNVTMALLNYPVLMAADILIYKAGLVPVGIDQEPHLEVAREIARKMNDLYGLNFLEPKRFATKGEYVPSLTGEGKMSKSVESSFINLTDSLETVKKKLSKVPTDSGSGNKLPDTGGVATLLTLVDLFMGSNERLRYEEMYTSKGIKYSELKDSLGEAIYKDLEPIQKKRKELEKNSEYVEKVIKDGAKKARKIASQTVLEVKQKMGLI